MLALERVSLFFWVAWPNCIPVVSVDQMEPGSFFFAPLRMLLQREQQPCSVTFTKKPFCQACFGALWFSCSTLCWHKPSFDS